MQTLLPQLIFQTALHSSLTERKVHLFNENKMLLKGTTVIIASITFHAFVFNYKLSLLIPDQEQY